MDNERHALDAAEPIGQQGSPPILKRFVMWFFAPQYTLSAEIRKTAVEYKKALMFANTNHGRGLGSAKCVRKDRDWSEYPVGTKAMAIGGGYWEKTGRGWKWCSGATFPRPGGDASGWVCLPTT